MNREEFCLTENLGFLSWGFCRFETISTITKVGGEDPWPSRSLHGRMAVLAGVSQWVPRPGRWCPLAGLPPALPCPVGNPQAQLHRMETELCKQSQLNKLQNIFHMQMNFNQFPNWIQSNYFFQYSIPVTCHLPMSPTFHALSRWL